ncbi:MAG: hypothetical protein K6E53_00870 [Lachnospiraceae bacterium]|nr:hypothetical protein [Lachnospiraceae bacterium]
MDSYLYYCNSCDKLFKLKNAGKKVKCTKCSSLLTDLNITASEYETLDSDQKDILKHWESIQSETVQEAPVETHETEKNKEISIEEELRRLSEVLNEDEKTIREEIKKQEDKKKDEAVFGMEDTGLDMGSDTELDLFGFEDDISSSGEPDDTKKMSVDDQRSMSFFEDLMDDDVDSKPAVSENTSAKPSEGSGSSFFGDSGSSSGGGSSFFAGVGAAGSSGGGTATRSSFFDGVDTGSNTGAGSSSGSSFFDGVGTGSNTGTGSSSGSSFFDGVGTGTGSVSGSGSSFFDGMEDNEKTAYEPIYVNDVYKPSNTAGDTSSSSYDDEYTSALKTSNILSWVLCFMPFILTMIGGVLARAGINIPNGITMVAYIAIVVVDINLLRKCDVYISAGYGILGVLFQFPYLFRKANLLGQKKTCAIISLVMFILTMLLVILILGAALAAVGLSQYMN